MIISMTGFGKASRSVKKLKVNAELRSVNSKYLEVSCRLPMVFSDKESEIREVISQKISRGKISVQLGIEKSVNSDAAIQVKPEAVKDYFKLLNSIKKTTGIKEEIKLEHILKFSEIFKGESNDDLADYWSDVKKIISAAVSDLLLMKAKEGKVLEKDILSRLSSIEKKLDVVTKLSVKNVGETKRKMMEKVNKLLNEANIQSDNNRLEYELIMISDRLDITEEVIRAKSHIHYFRNNVKQKELSGRRLNFLVQEINREINTIASKSNSSEISQFVVEMKEELEKIKEQLQNIE
ncbi:MAG TPA: YicC family protein [Ignavibacteria bacterium]|nr:YicC family protein [Ignavibacteria bacterium]HRF67146.1 YicC family protein [Ignavibacteria bacterium]